MNLLFFLTLRRVLELVFEAKIYFGFDNFSAWSNSPANLKYFYKQRIYLEEPV